MAGQIPPVSAADEAGEVTAREQSWTAYSCFAASGLPVPDHSEVANVSGTNRTVAREGVDPFPGGRPIVGTPLG